MPYDLHNFLGGLYAKRVELTAGQIAEQHKHAYDHVSALAKGRVVVSTDFSTREHVAPAFILIPAGMPHKVEALEDSLWFCVHITDETDSALIDEVLIATPKK